MKCASVGELGTPVACWPVLQREPDKKESRGVFSNSKPTE